MTKKQFIWLVIRFVGFAYLFMAVPAVLMLGNRVWNLIKSSPYDQPTTYFFHTWGGQASASAVTVAMTIYCFSAGLSTALWINHTPRLSQKGLIHINFAELWSFY